MKNREAKQLFEENFRECSDSTWYKTKRIFNDTFPMTRDNVIWVAKIKSMLPKLDVTSLDIVQSIHSTNSLISSRTCVTGEQFLSLLEDYGITIHKNTLTNWFRPLEGFSRRRTYTMKQMTPVVLAAFTWKLKKEIKNL